MGAFTDDNLIVQTTGGKVRGTRDGLTNRWLGVPYAAPPVGKLRYRAPQPVKPWKGVRDALEFGHAAPQEPTKVIPLPAGITIDEDCLNLNIWVPERVEGDHAPRPVMVWLHGGAYFIGFSAQPIYNGRSLAENGDVIVVTLNYRLGALGFLDFSPLSKGANKFESNLGLRDIIQALEWVKENIASFGGNPDDVTLFGESAGGGCVTTLMTTTRAAGLFHKAIAQSSPATSVYGPERAAKVADVYLDLLGVNREEAPTKLREMDAVTLASVTTELLNHVALTAPGTVAFAPIIDGDLITDYPVKLFRAGKAMKIPLIIGTNHDEAALFKMMKSPLMPITEASITRMFQEVALENPKLTGIEPEVIAAYPRFPKQRGSMEISRDAGFRLPSIWVAEAHSKFAPTWMYRFDQAPPLMKVLGLGASHGTEIPYAFGNMPIKKHKQAILFRLGGLKVAKLVSQRMQAHWLAFGTSGNPETTNPATGALMPWPQYTEETRATLVIDQVDRIELDPDGVTRVAWGERVVGFK